MRLACGLVTLLSKDLQKMGLHSMQPVAQALCVLHQVRAGTGGDEAALFAGDLLRMYERAAALNGWKFEVSNCGWSTKAYKPMSWQHMTVTYAYNSALGGQIA